MRDPDARLLNQKDAAAYCGMSAAIFNQKCNVKPIAMGVQFLRYDKRKLDDWIDYLQNDSKQENKPKEIDHAFYLERLKNNG